ncbi:MAG TPA: hypothetical protein VFN15_01530 [Solirubrobacterales bacterium]|nr:hypothetical protein [Solirubrobacterales bacterium]
MRRLALPILLVLLALPAGAQAAGTGGHNPATLKLERSFTTALSTRIESKNGCYPAEAQMAKQVRKRWGFKVAVVNNLKQVRTSGLVYVIKSSSNCNNVRFALRQGALYELDAARGEIVVLGQAAARQRRIAAERANRGPLRSITTATKTYNVSKDHRRLRFEANCPGGRLPLGGGMVATPPVGAGGEGIYPHSYERLGAQRGWHITAWLFDGGDGSVAPRQLSIQAVCGRGLSPMSAPHKTVFVKPGQTRTATARCPGGQKLMSGGYQRTDFLGDGGDYITESRALGSNKWRVSAGAHGEYGGELTAIAYCVQSKRPLLTAVEASAPVGLGVAATATTPQCPGKGVLASGGFSFNGTHDAWFAGGSINGDGTWSATGYGLFGPAPSLTAYGYCLQPGS